jgi:hypothetical protein
VSRRYLREPVDVVEREGQPTSFRWRGRRYVIRAVLAHWVEAMPWWSGRRASGEHALRHVWRVEAAGGTGVVGAYDLHQQSDGWRLARVLD